MSVLSLRPVLVAVVGALPFMVHAQTKPVNQLDQIVVTPARTTQKLANAIGDVTVIGQDKLEKAGKDSVADILSREVGIEIYTNGGPQNVTGVYLRGTNPQHTRVMIDGMRINNAATGSTAWAALDPALIERIEIIRGAASSLYGSDAIGGVVNIITKKGAQDRPLSAWANVGIGSYNTFKSSAGISGASKGWDYSFNGSYADSDGFATINKPGTPSTGYTQHGFSGTLGYAWAQDQHLGFSGSDTYIDGAYVGPYSFGIEHALQRQQAYTLSSDNKINAHWSSKLSAGFSKNRLEMRPGTTDTAFIQRQYSWQNDIDIMAGQRVSLITERLEERMTSASKHNHDKRNTNAVGLIYRGDMGAHHVQGSVRNDNISGFGNKATGGLAYDLDLSSNWTIGVAGNTGFRTPTFADLYYPLAWGFQGNPDLKPEKSRNIEASLRYANDTTSADLVVYQNTINDLINTYDCTSYPCTTTNTERARIRGLTLSAAHTIDQTRLYASIDLKDPKDRKTGNMLIQRAKQQYKLGVEHAFQHATVGAEYQFSSYRYSDAANKVRLGGYGLLNLTASLPITSTLEAQLRWNNALDKRYEYVKGYNTERSNVFINLAWRM